MSEPFSIGRPYKYMENLENEYTDHFLGEVMSHYGTEEITELTEDQIMEVQAAADELLDDNYTVFLSMCIQNIVNMWENETYEAENDD